MVVFVLGAAGVAVLFVLAVLRTPGFGEDRHPYRDAAIDAALRQRTPNVVSSLNFDQRGFDSVGEEAILVAAVIGAATLLRRWSDPAEADEPRPVPAVTRLAGYVLLPVTLLIGADVVVHGHLTPGGGFQGGVVLATGLHLLYIAGDYRALVRARPLDWYEFGEAAGLGAVVLLGVASVLRGAGFLANILPLGTSGQLLSAGVVPLFSCAIGLAVSCGVVVLLAQFLAQYLPTKGDSA